MDIANGFSWINRPAECAVHNDSVEIVTTPYTDLWQRTYYHFSNDNAPMLARLTSEQYFSFAVTAAFACSRRFDQCGIVVYIDSGNLLKASAEYDNDQTQQLGSVVTNLGYSDWATAPIPAAIGKIRYRLSRREKDFRIEAAWAGSGFAQLRICHLDKAAGEIRFGIYACSPEDSSFRAIFSDFEISECQWAAHDGQAPD